MLCPCLTRLKRWPGGASHGESATLTTHSMQSSGHVRVQTVRGARLMPKVTYNSRNAVIMCVGNATSITLPRSVTSQTACCRSQTACCSKNNKASHWKYRHGYRAIASFIAIVLLQVITKLLQVQSSQALWQRQDLSRPGSGANFGRTLPHLQNLANASNLTHTEAGFKFLLLVNKSG